MRQKIFNIILEKIFKLTAFLIVLFKNNAVLIFKYFTQYLH